MIEKSHSQPLVTPPKGAAAPTPVPTAKPQAPAADEARPRLARDTASIGGVAGSTSTSRLTGDDDEFNPLDARVSPGRAAADISSGVSAGFEVARDARGIAGTVASVGGRFSALSRVGTTLSRGITRLADWADDVARAAPAVGRGFAGIAKAAPLIGLGIAGLDIGRAVLEKNPEKKREAKGTAALSTVSSVSSIAGTALLATPLAPLGIGLIAVGIGASAFSFVDTTFFKGAASKRIGDAVDAVADAGKAVGGAIAGGAKQLWGAITSL